MCLIIASNGPKPSEEVLRDGARRNSDGNGFAWLHKGQVQWRKGITIEETIKMVANAKGPFVVHFRIGTHGPKVPALTHPFPITAMSNPSLTGRATRVLFQNGTYPEWTAELKNTIIAHGATCPPPPWSDSRALAVMVYYLGVDWLRICGTSRFIVFDGSKPAGQNIDMIGEWYEAPDKCFYSNKFTSAFPTTIFGGGGQTNFPRNVDTLCGTGGSVSTPTDSRARSSSSGYNISRGGTADADAQAAALDKIDPRLVWTGLSAEGLEVGD